MMTVSPGMTHAYCSVRNSICSIVVEYLTLDVKTDQ